VMVLVKEGEHCMMHVSILRATGDVEKIEFHRLPVRLQLAHHARPVSCVTIMGPEQAITVQIEHDDQIVISYMSALPSISACCGTVVTWPSHVPARVFILSKDFCRSDWAKAKLESDIRATDSIRGTDLVFPSP